MHLSDEEITALAKTVSDDAIHTRNRIFGSDDEPPKVDFDAAGWPKIAEELATQWEQNARAMNRMEYSNVAARCTQLAEDLRATIANTSDMPAAATTIAPRRPSDDGVFLTRVTRHSDPQYPAKIRLPAKVIRAARLRDDSIIMLKFVGNKLVMERAHIVVKKRSPRLARARKMAEDMMKQNDQP